MIRLLMTLPFMVALSVGCAQKETRQAQQQENMQEAVVSSVIEFEDGSSELTEEHKSTLRSMVENYRSSGNIDSVKVAAWSDDEYPFGDQEELSESAKGLAADRAQNIEEFMQSELDVNQVSTYNMAEKPNWFDRTVRTEEAEVKSAYARRGSSDREGKATTEFRDKGEPTVAVVVVEGKQRQQGSGSM